MGVDESLLQRTQKMKGLAREAIVFSALGLILG